MLAGALLAAISASAPLSPHSSAQAAGLPAKLAAIYQLRFAGITLGDFKVWSSIGKDGYSVQGDGKITFLTGLIFEVEGNSRSTGTVSGSRPVPDNFSFSFKTRKKKGYLAMTFSNGAVEKVASQPPLRTHPKAVPVTPKHVRGALDPMTALFLAAHASKPGDHASVCNRVLPVYDGKYRFDLKLIHKRTVRVVKKGKNGYAGPAVICQVKFIPVAGHRPHASNVAFMRNTDGIEVWLMPIPQGNMYVPYHISVPTPYGTAQATARSFNVETAARQHFALVQ